MSRSPFDPRYENLPASLPIFPLPGALLLPGGRLPLNVFEPRYLNMMRDTYGLGKVLIKKYQLLRISYTLFMFALVIGVLAFMWTLFKYQGVSLPL